MWKGYDTRVDFISGFRSCLFGIFLFDFDSFFYIGKKVLPIVTKVSVVSLKCFDVSIKLFGLTVFHLGKPSKWVLKYT